LIGTTFEFVFEENGCKTRNDAGKSDINAVPTLIKMNQEEVCVNFLANLFAISPAQSITLDEAEKQMKTDGVQREGFYRKGDPVVQNAARFLYAALYGVHMQRDDRVRGVQQLVHKPSGNLRRLLELASEGLF
jgi:hypothetical protein